MADRGFEIIGVGSTYGKWTVIGGPTDGSPAHCKWYCKCACGKCYWINANRMVRGASTKCMSCAATRPGRVYKQLGISYILFRRLRMVAINAVSRCTRLSDSAYHNYGGRGVTVCPEWIADTDLFVTYLVTLDGYDNQELVLDRIDNDGHYQEGNLRFITRTESNYNRRIVGEARQFIRDGFSRPMKKLYANRASVSDIARLYCTQRHTVRDCLRS